MKPKSLFTVLLSSSLFSLAGCQSDYERIDGVSSFAGNAHAINRVNQAQDPWAKHSHDTDIRYDGQRIGNAVKRYKENEVSSETGIDAPTTN